MLLKTRFFSEDSPLNPPILGDFQRLSPPKLGAGGLAQSSNSGGLPENCSPELGAGGLNLKLHGRYRTILGNNTEECSTTSLHDHISSRSPKTR
jgi:hypothetical protein